MDKFKQWFFTPDEEGLSYFDALCMFIWNTAAWSLMIFLMKRFG